MQACDSTPTLDRTESAGGPTTTPQDTAITIFGNLMIGSFENISSGYFFRLPLHKASFVFSNQY